MGDHLNAKKILEQLSVDHQPARRRGFDRAIDLLRVSGEHDPRRWHRDGWVFQMLSWIAAQQSAKSKTLMKAPQPRTADKGLDGLIIRLPTSDELAFLVIGEDKATTDPRATITQKVWPELDLFESGARDAEVTSDVEALLSQISDDDERARLVSTVLWETPWRYRIAITIPAVSDNKAGRALLFDQYEAHVCGETCERRGAETYMVSSLRQWMDSFCENIIARLEEQRQAADV